MENFRLSFAIIMIKKFIFQLNSDVSTNYELKKYCKTNNYTRINNINEFR